MEDDILSCPFCNTKPEVDSPDFIHRFGHLDRDEEGNLVQYYSINCSVIWGGCSASILGESEEECLEKWNTRPRETELENILRDLASRR